MKEIVTKLLKACPSAEPSYFESSNWFEEESPATIRKIIKAYEKHYERRLFELIQILGEPNQTESTHGEVIDKWYPEAIRAAWWDIDRKTLCLAMEQHDRESPISVVLICRSFEEIEELSS